MSFQFLNAGRSGDIQQVTPIDTFIDPVSKIRVSNPSNLIDTDFEYGLQPTKWETVELINNTPAFFSKGGDTTIPDITSITTNAGTREVTVTTAFPHNLDVGIPLRVAGTKSVTADGSYIINATPTDTTFTYLARGDQPETVSIFDLYTSVITGEFFQGSQITISDAEGITTNGTEGEGAFSTLTVKTENKHGFGENTPFYFLNLNSTISQEFEAQNTASVAFDPTNSAAAQSFDGSNTLLQTPIDLSNSATTSTANDTIQTTSPTNSTFTVFIAQTNETSWNNLKFGDPLYYSVSAGAGYFQSNPRGVVFVKSVNEVNAAGGTATFQVSQVPNGDTIPVVASITGFFQIADQARTFPGNNVDEQSQIELQVEVGQEFLFDGGNQGYLGDLENSPSNVGTVIGYTGTSMTLFTSEGTLDYYEGAMLKYESSGDVATGLINETTYFVTFFEPGQSPGLFTMSISEFPGEDPINVSGGSGGQTFSKIGVSIDKDIVHVRNSNFEENDMLEYTFPTNGNFQADEEKIFYFVIKAYDIHNYELVPEVGFNPLEATGGTVILDIYDVEATSQPQSVPGRFTSSLNYAGRFYKAHSFTSVGSTTFTITEIPTAAPGESYEIEYLIVGGGGGGGSDMGGGGGAGGYLAGKFTAQEGTYTITVGGGGNGAPAGIGQRRGFEGENSSVVGPGINLVSFGGGGGASAHDRSTSPAGGVNLGLSVGSGGGASGGGQLPSGGTGGGGYGGGIRGTGTVGQGNDGGTGIYAWYPGGGGGASGPGGTGTTMNRQGNPGGPGTFNSILGGLHAWAGGGGASGYSENGGNGGLGGGGATGPGQRVGGSFGINRPPKGNGGYKNSQTNRPGSAGGVNTGGGGGGGMHYSGNNFGGAGGSGIVVLRYPVTPQRQKREFNLAVGGVISTVTQGDSIYAVHSFPEIGNSNNFEILQVGEVDAELEFLVVGGGGGGGFDMGGGGGGGSVISGKALATLGTYSVNVGNGGFGAGANIGGNSNGHQYPVGSQNGEDSTVTGPNSSVVLRAKGGGAGGSSYWQYTPGANGLPGGNGGGASGYSDGGGPGGRVGGTSTQASSGQLVGLSEIISGQSGFTGGWGGPQYYAGGGAGAGGNGVNSSNRPDGGPGIANSILGTSYVWGGGGGGSGYSSAPGHGGSGGGGGGGWQGGTQGPGSINGINPAQDGEVSRSNAMGGNGGENTGGGGGGGTHYNDDQKGGNGGSGFIAIRYKVGEADL